MSVSLSVEMILSSPASSDLGDLWHAGLPSRRLAVRPPGPQNCPPPLHPPLPGRPGGAGPLLRPRHGAAQQGVAGSGRRADVPQCVGLHSGDI